MTFTKLEDTFWVSGFLGHLTLMAVLIIRGRWRTSPVFAGLIGYELLESICLFLVSRHGTQYEYFVAYWLCAALDYILQLALLAEIATGLCRRNGIWIGTARSGILRWALFGIVFATALSFTVAPASITGLDLWDLRATLFTSLLTCQLLVGVSMTGNRLRLQRGNHTMALGQGLALWAAVAVLADVCKIATGWRHDFPVFDQVRMVVYLADLLFWMVAFWRPAREVASFVEQADYMAVLNNACAPLAQPRMIGR